ncbi:MAG: hypothetical protein WDN47_02695 [Candidatus Doudnabacteria bacterium]
MRTIFEREIIPVPEFDESRISPDNLIEKKKSLFEKVRQGVYKRLNAMALAGFLTVSLSSESYADQVKFAKPENAPAHFVIEKEVDADKLENFKNKVKAEEPEFAQWTEDYASSVKKGMDEMSAQIDNFSPDKDRKEEKEFEVESSDKKIYGLNPKYLVKRNHKVLEELRTNKDFRKAQQMLKDNLENILWRFIQMDDSAAVRNTMREKVEKPNIDFKYHQGFELDRSLAVTTVHPQQDGEKLQSNLKFSPTSFVDVNGKIDINLFVNTFVHELYHGMHPGSQKQEPGLMTGFQLNMIEGIAQNVTFEVMQSIARNNDIKSLRPEVGMNGYDELVVLASITDAVIRPSKNPDLLAQWNAGIISEQKFLSAFKKILPDIGIDPGLADDLAELSSNQRDPEVYSPVTKAYESMLARLKISGYELSPKFVEGILKNGRKTDSTQDQNVAINLKLSKLNEKVSRRMENIKNKE